MNTGISRAVLNDLIARAAASPHVEICGLLLGDGGGITVAVAATNVAADPSDSFEIDPAALFAAHRAARAGGPAVIGHYHSHPNGLAEPSRRDAAAAIDPNALWLILAGGKARLFRVADAGSIAGRFEPVALDIVPATSF